MACVITPDFSFSVSGKTVRFANKTKATGCIPKEFYWLFGDGDEEFVSSPTHTFPAYGKSYSVKLRVSDGKGTTRTATKTVRTGSSSGGGSTALVCTTTANFSHTVSGKTVSFRDTSRTSRKSGTGSCSIRERYWVFNNKDEEFTANPRYTFPAYDRSYTVKLRVKDSSGRSVTTTKTVRTGSSSSGGGGACPTPTASFTYSPSSPRVGDRVTFRASTSSGGSGYSISKSMWYYGDGRGGSSNSYAYPKAGTYTAKLEVTNSCGKKKTVSKSITIGSGSSGGSSTTFNISITTPDNASISVSRV